jgi:hypothetical protein
MKKAIPFVSAIVIAITAYELRNDWYSNFGSDYLYKTANSLMDRPFVYRALLPLLSQVAEQITGIGAEHWLMTFVVLCAVGFYFALRYSIRMFAPTKNFDLLAFLGSELLLLLIIMAPYPYDVSTALTFILCYILLAQERWLLYLALFPLATLNRETTCLLIALFAVWGFLHLPVWNYVLAGMYQVFIWLGIRWVTAMAFADHAGSEGYFRLWHNLDVFGRVWWLTLTQFVLLAVIVYLVFRAWRTKPLFLRIAFIVLFPLQVCLYLLFGEAFEIRVFVEVWPVLWLLMIMSGA